MGSLFVVALRHKIAERAQAVGEVDILNDGGIIICESRLEKTLPALSAPYFVEKERTYGKIKITVCGKRNETV